MDKSIELLMCAPDHFGIRYVINPWMEGNLNRSVPETAIVQWRNLVSVLEEHAKVHLIRPQPNLPDMVFTANAGLVLGRRVILSRFLHRERQGEETHFKRWFIDHGFSVEQLPADLPFEGAGDALLQRGKESWLWAAYGFRSELDSHPSLAQILRIEVVSLRLMDKRFYHLDTCLCPLEDGYVLYYPNAFDARSNQLIETRVPAERRIAVPETDAVNFACNAVNLGRVIVLNQASGELKDRLAAAGFQAIEAPMSEFLKSGGAVKCLTLRLTEPVSKKSRALSTMESRVITLRGHLLDSGLLNRVLDVAVEGGGSFRILNFKLGLQRQSPSEAEVRISAPAADVLDKIISQLIDLGAALDTPKSSDARLVTVSQRGVAPDDFYATTIYPTEVCVGDEWIRVGGQRMDAVVVVEAGKDGTTAQCRLLRDLAVGDRVVVGVDGIRTVRQAEARSDRGDLTGKEEFGFMESSVSSERRVELVVEQIAWEWRRIRERGGKAVVVAGPVVIHTGGAEHLAYLIREGYVQALLGGNAVAVHDIEQALLGTSLGIDLKHGRSVHGGHQHHLRAINLIRRCGRISAAVDQGLLKSGVMYECVRHRVPFALAGSIRDDGPLPDTEMNLVKAQKAYAELLQGAELILMLSSMLHSIGVGNMTPAGVKLVCVDINPAVVTKLADRGSVESVGVVTDVGLFLGLLEQQLRKLDGAFPAAGGPSVSLPRSA
jgi:lysine-ketoglutarate reductase/saccharopine dehydrogenase-like protein (TIGR00300 family)